MRARRPIAVALAFAIALVVFTVTRGDERGAAGTPAAPRLGDARREAGTDARIRRLQAALRAGTTGGEPELAAAYLQKARETADPAYLPRADGLLRRALARNPVDPAALRELGALALARHDFSGALEIADRARRAAPASLDHYPVLVDALVELGRYGTARATLQDMIDARPDLAGYARVSYLRELHGDLGGAAAAMARAAAAGGPVPENVAYVQTLLGDLELARGRPAAAERAYAAALAAVPGHVPAAAGRARLSALRGDLRDAIRRHRRIVSRLPLPEHAIALGEAELAAGRRVAGGRDLELVQAQRTLLAASGVDADVELAVFEADHGDPRRALALARRGWATAPSVRSADAVGWALARNGRPAAALRWARRALRLGSVDPLWRYHAGMAALAAGRPAEGRHHLRVALRHGLGAHPLPAMRARHRLGMGR